MEDKKGNPEIEQHLLKCRECRQELVEWEQIGQVLGRLPVMAPPPELLASVMRGVSRLDEERARSIPGRLNRWFGRLCGRLEEALGSEAWGSVVNFAAASAASWLFFTDRGTYSLGSQLVSLAESGGKLILLADRALNELAINDLLWSLKVEVIGSFYNLLVLWFG
ncbi:MAG: hypothetical protein QHH02_04605 [Syntrophomonadaceae bacterium]|nr:hypothetical protein [Syntrophomonadaceae bacterium]